MYNHIIIVGRVGRKPELKTSKDGKTYCRLSVVSDDGFGSNKSSTWHDVSAFGKTAENACKYLDKGSLCLVSGPLHANDYEKEGKKYHSLSVIAETIKFLPKKTDSQSEHKEQESNVQADYTSETDDMDIPF